jgi:hypothetical protein
MSFIQLLAAMGTFQETVPPVGAPDPPSNLSVASESTCTACSFDYQVQLSWTNGDSEQTRIYRDSVLQATVGAGVSTWQDDDALDEDTQYNYEICHYNGSLESTRILTPHTESGICLDDLSAPTVSASADSDTQITITCSGGGTDVDSYNVHLDDGTYLGNTGSGNTTFAHTPLSAGTQYSYKAKAKSADGCLSGYGASDSEYTKLATPAAPTAVVDSANAITLTLPAYGTAADRYRIFYAGGAEIATVDSPTTEYQVTGLTPATAYTFEIQAEDQSGDAGNSAKSSASTERTTQTGTISTLVATHDTAECPTASINLVWDVGDNDSATIKIERQLPSEGSYSNLVTGLTAGTEAYEDTTHDELAGTGTTNYRVSFEGITGGTTDTDSVTVDCRPDEPFGSDCTFVGGDGAGDINITWNDASAVPAETGFKIYRAPDSGGVPGTWVLIDTVGSGVEEYDDLLVPVGTWHWSVSSYNATGESDKNECLSNPLEVTDEEA